MSRTMNPCPYKHCRWVFRNPQVLAWHLWKRHAVGAMLPPVG
jgi:hypothetical protein